MDHINNTLLDFLKQEAKQGSIVMCEALVIIYSKGIYYDNYTIAANQKEAQKYAQRAKELKKAHELYLEAKEKFKQEQEKQDNGKEADFKQALELMEKVANLNNYGEAWYFLGKVYFNNYDGWYFYGIEQNYPLAVKYFEKAGEQDHILALKQLMTIYKKGIFYATQGINSNEEKAKACRQKIARILGKKNWQDEEEE
ncbi:hypothetical protein DMB95_07645 [Campylobacter sp. MIT 12-8780]|uniref:sel1 repeat family protein n=1 Tax=unclassified Campylobacter TaxID=2593542 RepID=UPI00115DB792|nr:MULTISPECIES: sel1 repeat family protein [unclassified Campylobacter]NDJ27994.1 sel1 repeat family protein [Campylobacter sp. MIT 19-121]TQR40486.1 hypothetical protein DMB95_07645 [Campylobacter sp. MIT 12-8780]